MPSLKCKIANGGLLPWLYFPWTALIWRALVMLLTSLFLSVPSSLLYSSLSSALFFFSRNRNNVRREVRSREGRYRNSEKKKKKTANMMERAQKLSKLFSCYWFTKLWIKLYCHPYEREKKAYAFLNSYYSFYCIWECNKIFLLEMLNNLNIFQHKIHFPKQWALFQGLICV